MRGYSHQGELWTPGSTRIWGERQLVRPTACDPEDNCVGRTVVGRTARAYMTFFFHAIQIGLWIVAGVRLRLATGLGFRHDSR